MNNGATWNDDVLERHWVLKICDVHNLFLNEAKLAKKIVKSKNDPNEKDFPLYLSHFSLEKGISFSKNLRNFNFQSVSDSRLAGWNGLFSYRESDRLRMMNYLIPSSQHESWIEADKIHKFLVKEDVNNLTDKLNEWKTF